MGFDESGVSMYNRQINFATLMEKCSINNKLFSENIKFIPISNQKLATIGEIRKNFLKI
jgi:hypothetical protein